MSYIPSHNIASSFGVFAVEILDGPKALIEFIDDSITSYLQS